MKSGFDFKYTASDLTFIVCSQDCHQIPVNFIKVCVSSIGMTYTFRCVC